MMDLRETLSVAIDALRGNKLRAILTSLGVIIGSASIVLVVTVALTSRKFVLSQIEPTVQEVAGSRELPMTIVVDGVERPVTLIGVTEGFQAIRRLVILRGRYFDSADMETRSKVCLVTKELSDRVFGLENPLGGNIRMGELTFTVIGVFRERVATFGLSDIQRDTLIIPFPLMKYYTGGDCLP